MMKRKNKVGLVGKILLGGTLVLGGGSLGSGCVVAHGSVGDVAEDIVKAPRRAINAFLDPDAPDSSERRMAKRTKSTCIDYSNETKKEIVYVDKEGEYTMVLYSDGTVLIPELTGRKVIFHHPTSDREGSIEVVDGSSALYYKDKGELYMVTLKPYMLNAISQDKILIKNLVGR